MPFKKAIIVSIVMTSIACWAQAIKPSGGHSGDYGRLPLTFEENHGQSDPSVRFVSRGNGYVAFLTAGGAVLSLRSTSERSSAHPTAGASGRAPMQHSTLELRLLGAASKSVVVGEDPQAGKVNYFLGNDKTKWHTNIQTYGRVRYKNIYPGIDLIYYGNHHQLEYDFAASPRADLSKIQFEIKGGGKVELGPTGELVVRIGNDRLRFQKPNIYQESNGVRTPVAGSYVVKDSNHVSFEVPNVDRTKSVVIDPVLVYSSYFGGSGDDEPTGIAVDGDGSVYVTGYTDAADFPVTNFGSLAPGQDHVFVAKFDSTGSNLLYADYIGGNNSDYAAALALDSQNEVYVTGSTASSDFPTVNAYQPTYPGSFNGFLTKLSSDGSTLLYSTYLGGNGSDTPTSLAVDGQSDVLVAGTTTSTNFPTANAYQASVSPNQGGMFGSYGFLTKVSPDGSALLYSTYLGGSSNVPDNCGGSPCWTQPENVVAGMVIDAAGNAYIGGTTNTYDFPVTQGAYSTTNSTQLNANVGFVTKFTSAGSLQYGTYFYEPVGFTEIKAIAVDGSDSAYVTGMAFSNGSLPITATSICDPTVYGAACSYGFVAKFDVTASNLLYSTFLGPNNLAVPAAIVLDASDDAYVLTSTSSSSFQTTNPLQQYAGGNDILLVEIDPVAGSQIFSTYLGGSGDEYASSMSIDSLGNLYITGSTNSADFPTTQQAYQGQYGGDGDGFIVKVATVVEPSISMTPGSLQFSAMQVGSTSAPQQVVLRNTGYSALTITSISTQGDFSESNNCGSSVASMSSCTLSITFTPTGVGQRVGAIVVTDNATGSPQSVSLSGTGEGVLVSVTPSSLTFSNVSAGSSSAVQNVTVSNQGNSSLSINSIQISGNFQETNNCPASLGAGASCTLGVKFSPHASGTQTGALTVSDSAAGSPSVISLSGNGTDFSLGSSDSSVTVKSGATATFDLTVTPLGGSFNSPIQLSCSGAPASSVCTLSKTSITPGASVSSITATISSTTSLADNSETAPKTESLARASFLQFQGFGIFGLLVVGSQRRKRKLMMLLLCVLLISGLLMMTGCAGGTGISQGNTKTGTSQSYTITVTGTAGTLLHTVPLTLTVQ